MLREAGYDVGYPAKNVLLSEEDCLEALQGCVAVIAGSEPYTDRVLAGLPQLRIISRNGVGYDRVDVPAATRRGVAVTITPEGNHQAVAEHAMALLLAVARTVAQNAIDTRRGLWRRRSVSIPLRGRTLGIVGLGRIGRSVAVRAEAFGVRLLAYEKFPDVPFVEAHKIDLVDLNTLLAQSDFVTLHTPMTAETRGMINRHTLARMKPGSLLINTARGGLVNEPDLVEALKAGHLAGAGLDVLVTEPPSPTHPLLALDNVIVTPHVSALDSQAIEDMAVGAARNILDIFAGKWPTVSLINSDVRAAWRQ
ncbi:MAG: phosphoglycerate dehydrogenase [Planctomycetia bacterium]|nr:phosphoglycerate dehydrogenase [Planctomycetia bacterium]